MRINTSPNLKTTSKLSQKKRDSRGFYQLVLKTDLVVWGVLLWTALLPPARAATSQQINVRDFGARADGITDDVRAIQAAIDAAIRSKEAVEVFLPRGKYRLGQKTLDLRPSGYADPHIHIVRAHNLRVRGEPGTLLLSGDLTKDFFGLAICDGVTVSDMEFDSDPLPYTQGTVQSVDAKNKIVILKVDKGYDDLDRKDFESFPQSFYELRIFDNPDYEGYRVNFFPHIKSRQRIGPQLWRCQLKFGPEFELTPQQVGKKWMHYGKGHYHSWAFRVDRSSNCTFENIKTYSVSEGGFSFWGNPGDLLVRNCYIGPPPGSGRVFTADGGTMMFYNRGTVSMIGCDFSHTDDGFNMGTQYSRISESPDPFTCGFKHWDAQLPPQVGDLIEVYDYQTSKRKTRAKLVTVQARQGGGYIVSLDRKVNFNLGSSQALAAGKETGADRVIDINSSGRAIIKNSRFSALRARCIMIKSPGSVIEGNTFYDTHMPAICGGEKLSAVEGPPARNLTIRNNVFNGIDAANIFFAGANNADIDIEGNTFKNCGRFPIDYADTQGVAIDIRNVSGAHIENNIFGPSPRRPPGSPQVTVEDSDNVKVGPNQGLKDVVRRPLQGTIN